jgi:hypothetical protein
MQLVLDCAGLRDFARVTGHLAKFGLGFVPILFDIVPALRAVFGTEFGRNGTIAIERRAANARVSHTTMIIFNYHLHTSTLHKSSLL